MVDKTPPPPSPLKCRKDKRCSQTLVAKLFIAGIPYNITGRFNCILFVILSPQFWGYIYLHVLLISYGEFFTIEKYLFCSLQVCTCQHIPTCNHMFHQPSHIPMSRFTTMSHLQHTTLTRIHSTLCRG